MHARADVRHQNKGSHTVTGYVDGNNKAGQSDDLAVPVSPHAT